MEHRSFRDEIARNKRDSIILVIVVSIILFGLIYSMAYFLAPEALYLIIPFSILLILVYAWSSYQYGDQVILAATKAKPAEEREYQYLRDVVEGLSIASGITPPEIYVLPSDELNAFATGKDPEHSSIAVTRGLTQYLDRQELEGVVAHEISHIKSRDIQFMTLVAVLVGLTAIISHIIIRSYRWGGRSRNRGKDREGGIAIIILLIGFILAIFAPIITRIIQFAISRRREYLADASAASLTRYPDGLADALGKIARYNKGRMDVSEAVSHIFISDPNKSALDALYATHPPIEERVKRLREM